MADEARAGVGLTGLLLRRARVGGAPVDVAVRDGRIAAMAPALPRDREELDLGGRALLRGLWDEHVHVRQAALAAARTSLAGSGSAGEALARMGGAVAEAAADEVVVGVGFQDGLWPDRPSLAAIDALAGGASVVLVSHDVHAVWLSSAAARRFGVDPGRSGVLREGPAFRLNAAVDALSADAVDGAVRRLGQHAARLGITGIVDFEMTWSRDAWRERMAQRWDGPRVEAAVYPQDLDRATAAGLGTGDAVPGAGGLLSVGPLKVLIDGALNTRTAYVRQPYPDGTRGLLTVRPEDLRALLERAASAGLLPAVHAIGDAAVTAALDAFEGTGTSGRIEHAQLVAAADVPRFAALGVTASVQPAHLLDDREVAERQWAGVTDRAYPFRSLLDAGVSLVFGSDAPVAPLDPWLAMRAAVARARPGEASWHAEQRIVPEAALAASTRGRLLPRVGDPADLIALDLPPERLDGGAVALTLVAGRVVHDRR